MITNRSGDPPNPAPIRQRTQGSYLGLLAASGLAWFVLVAAIFLLCKDKHVPLGSALIGGGLVTLAIGPVFLFFLFKAIRSPLSEDAETGVRLPFVLQGTIQGGHRALFLSGVLMLFSYFLVFVGAIRVYYRFESGAVHFFAFVLLLSVICTTLFLFIRNKQRKNTSLLRVTEDGLRILGTVRARNIDWPEIRRFRLNPTPLMLRIGGEPGPAAFRREEVSGNVKVVLDEGEFELPERYGMHPCDLRDLLNRARKICVPGSDSPEVPEPFGTPGTLVPAIQNDDLESLRNAARHLTARGYSGSIIPEPQLGGDERKPWISRVRGGYVLCLSDDNSLDAEACELANYISKTEVRK
ncbi:MAG: hypothetical protein WC712_08470 [Candidatus Brocadiia bacterium]